MNHLTDFADSSSSKMIEERIRDLLSQMTLVEKIGQMSQVDAGGTTISDELRANICDGKVGSVLNQVTPALNRELQRIAREETRLGIPLLIGRDVIHGFQTVMPIPLGQAASWNPDLVREGAAVAAKEAASVGINWTFAPMIDISRDARWGRIAESFGEDTYLTTALSVAMIEGFQGEDMSAPESIAACAKHFVGYGASEGGRDYSATNISENELRNIYLPPFKSAVDAGVASIMSSFSDLDGIPATANKFLLDDILRGEWAFDGLTVSDWDAIRELANHGIAASDLDAAYEAICAGIDMEMVGGSYENELPHLLKSGKIELSQIDEKVANILRIKMKLGLLEEHQKTPVEIATCGHQSALDTALEIATESIVLLKNTNHTLPLKTDTLNSIALIGPLADMSTEQLGTWVFDGDADLSVTVLDALKTGLPGHVELNYAKGLKSTIEKCNTDMAAAVQAARKSDIAILVLGEDAILSGEAHCRAEIDLPGLQKQLIAEIKATGTPIIAVIMAGRPLTIEQTLDDSAALLFAWHPGSMAGPALCNLLLGKTSPSGRLPVTFPKMVGQIPIYYNHKNTGRPPSPNTIVHIDDIQVGAPQTSLGMTAFHLDAGYEPLFPFGYGLSYAAFEYSNLILSSQTLSMVDSLHAKIDITNTSQVTAKETVQLYIRDLVGSTTRPVKELKGFRKIELSPGETRTVQFTLKSSDLAFYNRDRTFACEPGTFHLWVGPNARTGHKASFELIE